MNVLRLFAILFLAAQAAALAIGGRLMHIERESDGLQDVVTYDEHSLMVYGERVFVFSGEFHPFRLPVTDLWIDVFQKVKALGFNAVSFYIDWALVEGQEGEYRADGIFDFNPFFTAAKDAGIYLIARPGPYINAEVSGGGFPGWLQRLSGQLRTTAPDYLAATDNYMANIAAAIAKAQITNGGPIILVQPENEYSGSYGTVTGGFPNPTYFTYVKKQLRDGEIIVPFINNDAWTQGLFAPGDVVDGTTEGDVDIYGHDSYPLGFVCSAPDAWASDSLPTYFHASHETDSPSTFYAIPEFQGGSYDSWGGTGCNLCADLLNMEFERVFYKNDFASGVALLNLYMIFGGSNWGNLGQPGSYSSYDYGASITENREITREKYSELKLEANFLKVTPAFLTASVGDVVTGNYTTSALISTTPLWGNGSATNLYVVRNVDVTTRTPVTYHLTVSTSKGNLSIPQLGGSLILLGRDSKWHVTDYDLGGIRLLYSTAEIFTWKSYSSKTILVVYGGIGEQHELAVVSNAVTKVVEGTVTSKSTKSTTILNWQTSATRSVVQVGSLFIYILDRNTAYNYWVPDFVRNDHWGAFSANIGNTTSLIVEAGYLVRSAEIDGSVLRIYGDLNATVPINVIGAPSSIRSLYFNSIQLGFKTNAITGELSSILKYTPPKINLPDLSFLTWRYLDDLPEIRPSYDDSAWQNANHINTTNPTALTTPTSLYAGDYGFNAGTLVYRGHFIANGNESTFYLHTQGGTAFASSVWLNSTYIGSWPGNDVDADHNDTYTLPNLTAGKHYVFTILIDNQGLESNWVIGSLGDLMKTPRGILGYSLSGHLPSSITWKLTGNLGGESYIDKSRGPLNEGGLYAERQGYHQPSPPDSAWAKSSPETGITAAGVAFYSTMFELNLPYGYDIPLNFVFGNTTMDRKTAHYRALLWVNGYQFGKFVNNVGPEMKFPVPQGILNYHGRNWLAVEIWAQQAAGAHLSNLALETGVIAWTSFKEPSLSPMPGYSKRAKAY